MNITCYVRFVALCLLLGFAGLVVAQATPTNGLAPVERVAITEADLPALLKRVDSGALVRMPLPEFDALVRAAQQQNLPLRTVPVLTEARYRAKLLHDHLGENSLVGTAEWKIRRGSPDRKQMPLPGLQLAIRQANWPDGQEAALYHRPREGTYLDVPATGSNTLNLEWSLRGISEPGELRFSLNVPSSARATLDLELPNTLTPYVLDDDVICTGPTPTDNGNATWRIALGGASRLELVLRRNDAPTPTLLARLNTTIRLADVDGSARYEFRIDGALGGFTQLAFEHDATLTPTGVRVNNLDSWTVQSEADGRKIVNVRLREPTRSASVVLMASLTVPKPPQRFQSPLMTCRHSVLRSESLRWIMSDRVDVQQWSAGQYRLVQAEHLADRTYAIDLEPAIQLDTKAPLQAPNALVVSRSSGDLVAVQQSRWTLAAKEQLLQTTIRYTGRDGRTTHVLLRLPEQWNVEQVESFGRDAEYVLDGPNTLRVQLPRTPTPNESWETTVRLKRLNLDRSPVDRTFPLPDVEPLGVRTRDGKMTVAIEPSWQATWSGPVGQPPVETDPMTNELTLPHESEGPFGTLRIALRQPRYTVHVETELTTTSRTTRLRSQLDWQAQRGSLTALQWWTPSLVQEPWVWRDSQGQRVGDAVRSPAWELANRLGLLNPTEGWSRLATHVATHQAGYWWTLHVPKTSARELQLESDYEAVKRDDRWPLLWVKQSTFTARVAVNEQQSERPNLRSFKYGSTTTWQEGPQRTTPAPQISAAQMIGYLGDDGTLQTSVRFRVLHWTKDVLPVQLPEGVVVHAVLVDGQRVNVGTVEHERLAIAIPQTRTWVSVALTLQWPSLTSYDGRLPLVPPTIADFQPSVQHRWRISPRWQPLARATWQRQPTANSADVPWPDVGRGWFAARRLMLDQRLTELTANTREEWLSQLRDEYPKRTVVLDRRAFLNWSTSNADGWSVWENEAMVVVTTRSEFQAWQQQVPWDAQFPPAIESALAQAAEFGQDIAGRFVQLGDDAWLAEMSDDVPLDWAVLEQRDPTTPIVVVSTKSARVALWLLALFPVLVVAWRSATGHGRIFLALWLISLTAAFVLLERPLRDLLTVPILGAFVAAVWYAVRCRLWLRTSQPTRRSRSTTITHRVAGSAVLLLGSAVLSAADVVPKVYVLSVAGMPKEVLVPPVVLDQLRQAVGPSPAPLVITRAEYLGTVDGPLATITARYRVLLADEQPQRLRLPFGHMKLREVLVDGAPTGKIEADGNDLDLTLQGAGTHTVQLQFVVSVRSANGKEVRFTIPEVPQARLRFEVPAPATRLRLAGWRGAVAVNSVAKAEVIEADLGSASTIHVLWQAERETTPTFRVREASVWTIGANQSLLRTAIEYRVESGAATQLKLAIPADVEIASLDWRQEGVPTTAIRDWALSGGSGSTRTLTVQLQAPLVGRAVLQLEMVPNPRLAARPTLRVPSTQQADREAYVAIALEAGMEWADVQPAGVTPLEGLPAFQTVWSALWGQPSADIVHSAYRTTNKESPKLTGTIRQLTTHEVQHQVEWSLHPEQLVGHLTSRWSSADRLSVLEWPIPNGFDLQSLRVVGMYRWERVGSRVRVWLDKPVNAVTADWRLRQAMRIEPEGREIVLPTPNPGTGRSTCQARIQAAAGLVMVANALAPTADYSWKSTTNASQRLRVFPATGDLQARVDITVEMPRDALLVHHRISWDQEALTRPHIVWLRFPAGAPADVNLMLPPGWTARVKGTGPQRTWEITMPAGRTEEPLRLTTRLATSGVDRWALPRCELWHGPQRVPWRSQTVAVPTKAVVLEADDGLLMEATGRYRGVATEWQATLRRSGADHQNRLAIERGTITAQRIGEQWHYHARYSLALAAEQQVLLFVEHLPRITAVHIDHAVQPPQAIYTLDPTVKTMAVEWTSSELRAETPKFSQGGETWQPAGDWYVHPPEGSLIVGATPPRSRPATLEPEWLIGLVQYRSTEIDQAPNFSLQPRPSKTFHPRELVALFACLSLIGWLTLLPRRGHCEQMILAAIVGLALLGTAGGPWLIVLLTAVVWQVRDLLRWWQGPPPTTSVGTS